MILCVFLLFLLSFMMYYVTNILVIFIIKKQKT